MRAHHRRRPHRKHPARAAARTPARAHRSVDAGRGPRSSTGCRSRATSTTTRCTARSTAASAWCSWSRDRPTRRPRSTRSPPRASKSFEIGAIVERSAGRAADGGRLKGVILISGRGSNMRSIVEAGTGLDVRGGDLEPARREGPRMGRSRGIETRVVDHKKYPDARGVRRRARATRSTRYRPDLIVLAGFMRILTEGLHRTLSAADREHPSVAAAGVSRAAHASRARSKRA